jgi:ribose transport system substrate-binding protein
MGEKIEAGKYTVVQTYLDGSVPAKAKENSTQALSDYPDLDCMVGLYGYNVPMCLEALEAADKLGQVKVVAFDQFKETLDGIEKGYVFAAVAQDPFQYGYEAVRLLVGLAKKQPHKIPFAGRGETYLQCLPVTKENLDEFRKNH